MWLFTTLLSYWCYRFHSLGRPLTYSCCYIMYSVYLHMDYLLLLFVILDSCIQGGENFVSCYVRICWQWCIAVNKLIQFPLERNSWITKRLLLIISRIVMKIWFLRNGYIIIIDGYVDYFDLSKTPLKLNISLNCIVYLYTIHKITVTSFIFLVLDFR